METFTKDSELYKELINGTVEDTVLEVSTHLELGVADDIEIDVDMNDDKSYTMYLVPVKFVDYADNSTTAEPIDQFIVTNMASLELTLDYILELYGE